MAKCKTCGKRIVWSRTIHDKPIPLDPEPVYGGNVVLEAFGALARVVAPQADTKRYQAHFVTCPQADKHRR